jgi:hypothetical protein
VSPLKNRNGIIFNITFRLLRSVTRWLEARVGRRVFRMWYEKKNANACTGIRTLAVSMHLTFLFVELLRFIHCIRLQKFRNKCYSRNRIRYTLNYLHLSSSKARMMKVAVMLFICVREVPDKKVWVLAVARPMSVQNNTIQKSIRILAGYRHSWQIFVVLSRQSLEKNIEITFWENTRRYLSDPCIIIVSSFITSEVGTTSLYNKTVILKIVRRYGSGNACYL